MARYDRRNSRRSQLGWNCPHSCGLAELSVSLSSGFSMGLGAYDIMVTSKIQIER